MPETRVRSLGREVSMENMATHSSILARRIPWTEGAWLATYSPWGRKESDTTEGTEYTHGFHRLLCSHRVHIQGVLRQAAARFSSFLEAHSFGSVSHAGAGRPSASESLILTEHASSCMDQNFLEFWILLFFFLQLCGH